MPTVGMEGTSALDDYRLGEKICPKKTKYIRFLIITPAGGGVTHSFCQNKDTTGDIFERALVDMQISNYC